jgi:hypothetical protein
MSRHYDDIGYSARQRREDEAADAYAVAYAIEDDRRRREWEAEFETIPYRSNGKAIHEAVMARSRGR